MAKNVFSFAVTISCTRDEGKFSAIKFLKPRLRSNTGFQADQGEAIGTIAPLKPTKVTLFTISLYNSLNSIRHIRPFFRPLF